MLIRNYESIYRWKSESALVILLKSTHWDDFGVSKLDRQYELTNYFDNEQVGEFELTEWILWTCDKTGSEGSTEMFEVEWLWGEDVIEHVTQLDQAEIA